MGRAPVLYVMGNHDDRYKANPPEGCVCVEERVYNYKGLRIAGLGGCMRYKPDGIYLYTEEEQRRRVQKLKRQLQRYHGADIFLTTPRPRGWETDRIFPIRALSASMKFWMNFIPNI